MLHGEPYTQCLRTHPSNSSPYAAASSSKSPVPHSFGATRSHCSQSIPPHTTRPSELLSPQNITLSQLSHFIRTTCHCSLTSPALQTIFTRLRSVPLRVCRVFQSTGRNQLSGPSAPQAICAPLLFAPSAAGNGRRSMHTTAKVSFR